MGHAQCCDWVYCMQQGDAQYSSVYRRAEAYFMHIREGVAQESAPATLKAAFLEPISRSLATDLSVHLFARTDQHFMSWFTCKPPLLLPCTLLRSWPQICP